MEKTSATAFQNYYKELSATWNTGLATEHSYRPALKRLIESIGGRGTDAVNEPTHVDCGAPDFIVRRNGVPIGHVECKDVGANLSQIANTDQLKRYRKSLPNLLLTDYLEFRWYVEGELRYEARLMLLDGNKIKYNKIDAASVFSLFEEFLTTDTPPIGSPLELAERMAAKARLMRGTIEQYSIKREARDRYMDC